jgi:gas vesicle protein
MTKSKLLTAIATGVAAGVVVGFLFAPHKGKKTRAILKSKGMDIAMKTVDKAVEGQMMVNDLKTELKNTIKSKVDSLINGVTSTPV